MVCLFRGKRRALKIPSQHGICCNPIEEGSTWIADLVSMPTSSNSILQVFSNIIATRNISPETLNCSCCQPAKNTTPLLFTRMKQKRFQLQQQQWKSASLAFPQQCSNAFQVPELMTHTCGRRHGFLGRVVAPLIERRRQLKQQIVVKGDAPIVNRMLSNGSLSRVLVTQDIETLVLVVLKHMKPYALGLVNFSCRPSIVPKNVVGKCCMPLSIPSGSVIERAVLSKNSINLRWNSRTMCTK